MIGFTLKVMLTEIRLLDFDKFKATCADLVKNTKLYEMYRSVLMLAPIGCREIIIVSSNLEINKLNNLRVLVLDSLTLIFKGIRERSYRIQNIPHIQSLYESQISWCVS